MNVFFSLNLIAPRKIHKVYDFAFFVQFRVIAVDYYHYNCRTFSFIILDSNLIRQLNIKSRDLGSFLNTN